MPSRASQVAGSMPPRSTDNENDRCSVGVRLVSIWRRASRSRVFFFCQVSYPVGQKIKSRSTVLRRPRLNSRMTIHATPIAKYTSPPPSIHSSSRPDDPRDFPPAALAIAAACRPVRCANCTTRGEPTAAAIQSPMRFWNSSCRYDRWPS